MDWLSAMFIADSPIQTVMVLSVICALGLALGKVKVMGVSLGVAFVFFVGILAGHWGLQVDARCLAYAETSVWCSLSICSA